MNHMAKIERDWIPLCTNTLYEIPIEHPIIRMIHKQTAEHSYFDTKRGRFLSQQEAFDAMSGRAR